MCRTLAREGERCHGRVREARSVAGDLDVVECVTHPLAHSELSYVSGFRFDRRVHHVVPKISVSKCRPRCLQVYGARHRLKTVGPGIRYCSSRVGGWALYRPLRMCASNDVLHCALKERQAQKVPRRQPADHGVAHLNKYSNE